MKFYTISNDLSISNDERFGNYDKYTVFELLRNIERNFSICIGKMPYSNTPCKILYHPLHPMIVNVPYERIIFLSVPITTCLNGFTNFLMNIATTLLMAQ